MDEISGNQTEPLLTVLRDQMEYLLAMLSRPVVQQQIMVVIVVLVLASVVHEYLRRRLKLRKASSILHVVGGESPRSRLASASYFLVSPIFALIVYGIAIRLFKLRGVPSGLLEEVLTIIWMWLIYRIIVMVIYIFYGESSKPYRRWILSPLFAVLVIVNLLGMLPGSVTLSNAAVNLGTISISIGNLVTASFVFYLFIIAGWVVREMMMHWLPSRIRAEEGVIDSVATVTRYALLSVGTVVSLSVLGLDFTSLAIIAGGLSVGIGIGLQDFVANFVSGLVLLFEQTLKPGDVVEIEDRICRVKSVSLRATTVTTLTNHELIFPNSIFTSQKVTNLTKSDRVVRVLAPFSVSYGSSPDRVRDLATQTALQHPLTMAEPPPFVAFLGYGESSLDFNLSFSINEPVTSGRARSDMYYMLWETFAENDIEIPFPQRVLHLGEGWDRLSSEPS